MRHFPILLVLFIFSCTTRTYPPLEEETQFLRNIQLKPFYHGVASGDPHATSVILWTRVTPDFRLMEIDVSWEVSRSEDFRNIIASGETTTNPERDFTVKVEAAGLKPGTPYFYRFRALNGYSPIGRTRTLPDRAHDPSITLAVVSCSNYEWGYFNSYGALANEKIDAVIHLGDYIYEYGRGGYGDTTLGRFNLPAHEIITLNDYRTRYSQYRLDPDLQAAHAAHPFINIWDDHEITNNSHTTGAQNHQENEGDYEVRKAAAIQAYYEWLPIREKGKHYRSFSFGKRVDLFMLDERMEARTQQPDSLTDPRINALDHQMIGKEQMDWLLIGLDSSQAKWKLIGNQVIFSRLDWGYETFGINLDSWDGYPGEQKQLADFLRNKQQKDVIFITGDTHSSWALEVTEAPFENYNPMTSEGAVAVEFGTTSLNSGNANERFADSMVLLHEKKLGIINPHMKYTNLRDHGYMLVELYEEDLRVTWKYVKTLTRKNSEIGSEKTVKVAHGTAKIEDE